MRGDELLDKMGLIDFTYVEAAQASPPRRKRAAKRFCAAAACLCLAACLAVPAMAASSPAFYDRLYALSPAAAQFFKPVELSCEDNGFRMTVEAVYLHETTAEIWISLRDLSGAGLDETVDLLDSYRINTPYDCAAHCQVLGYDDVAQSADLLITIEQPRGQDLAGEKITFSIGKILPRKEKFEGVLEQIDLASTEQTVLTQTIQPRGLSGLAFTDDSAASSCGWADVLAPDKTLYSPVRGVTLTGIGFLAGDFHVQAYYEDVGMTDNNGEIFLKNRETGELVSCAGAVSFFDEASRGSYEEYIFRGIDSNVLGLYDLYGSFSTSAGAVEGSWSVTFPLKDSAAQ